MIPPVLKNTIKKEVLACIVEEGRDTKECIDETSEYYDLDDDDREELMEHLTNGD